MSGYKDLIPIILKYLIIYPSFLLQPIDSINIDAKFFEVVLPTDIPLLYFFSLTSLLTLCYKSSSFLLQKD